MIRSIKDIFTTARSRILLQLQSRPHTVSELSRMTGYSKSTLSYHLEKLVETGMVKRVDNGRKWIYYELTEKGKSAIKYDIAKLAVFLGGGSLSLITAAYRLASRPGTRVIKSVENVTNITYKIVTGDSNISEKAPVPTPTPAPTPTPTPVPAPTPTPRPMGGMEIEKLADGLIRSIMADATTFVLLIAGIVFILLFMIYRRR